MSARHNYHAECEARINKQINMELRASYIYQAMAFHFDRDDVSMPNFHKFFKKQSDEERGHAEKLMKYQNLRGGRLVYEHVEKPPKTEWLNGISAMEDALALEKEVNQSLLELHKVASAHNDPQMCDFVESEFLKEQVESIKELCGYIAALKCVGPGLGEYMFDRETLGH